MMTGARGMIKNNIETDIKGKCIENGSAQEQESIMQTVKNTITVSIKTNTHRGFIGWSSCDNICMDMHDCLDMCYGALAIYEYSAVLETAAYILVSGVKLASYADSSSGMLTDVIMRTYELIDSCTKAIEKQDKQIRDKALTIIIKEAKKKAFDGWPDWRYELLKCGIRLCDEKSAKKFEKSLDTMLDKEWDEYSSKYTKREDLVVRYLLHRHLYGKESTHEELYKSLYINELRIIAVKDALEDKNYDEAEKLCLEKAQEESLYYRSSDPEDWNNLLFDIYRKSNNKDKQITQAKKLLMMGNDVFWDVLKQLYTDRGEWEDKYIFLLDELKNGSRKSCYRSILVAENEKKRLLEDLTENTWDLFNYGEYLAEDYPEQLYELCYNVIRNNCAQAKDRREYRKVTSQIKQLIKWKGNEKAKILIEELKQTYKRRPALLDELSKAEKKL